MSHVALVRIHNGELKTALSKALKLVNFKFPEGTSRIAIKPNLCYYWDSSTGQTTDPELVGAFVELARECTSPDVDISLVESDASAMKCEHAFRFLGYEKLARDYGVKLVNLAEDETTHLKVTAGNQTFSLMLPRTIADSSLKVNITKIKYTMHGIDLTCALKNIFGCNPYPKKFRLHSKLAEAIVALNKAMKFDIHIIDANIVAGMQTRKLGLIAASTDPVALDSVASKIVGLAPNRIGYLKLAEKEGLGKLDFITKGEPLRYFRDRFPRKNARKKLMGKAYTLVMKAGLGRRLGLE